MISYIQANRSNFEVKTLETENLFDFETALTILMAVAPVRTITRGCERIEFQQASLEIARRSLRGTARHIATSDPYLNTLPENILTQFEVGKENIGGTLMFYHSMSSGSGALLAYDDRFAIHPQARDMCFRLEFR